MICVFFGVSYSQEADTVHNVGKDKDGDTWYLDTSLIRRLDPPSDWAILMPIYTEMSNSTLVFVFNVDCSDSTYQLVSAFSFDKSGRRLFHSKERTAWAKFTGYSGNAARITCRTEGSRRLPTISRGVVSE